MTLRGMKLNMTVHFMLEVMQVRRQQCNIFKVLKENSCQPIILLRAQISFKNENKLKSFSKNFYL